VKIFLEKTSPVGAGLGGGSSDAAFALKMLNELCALELSEEALAGYAARLGSDCAFFIYNRPMIGEGRGEVLSEYKLSGLDYGQGSESQAAVRFAQESFEASFQVKVLSPEGIAVSTADAYRGIKPKLPETPLKEALAKPIEDWKDCLFNDFETTVFDKHPELAAIKRSLYDSGAVYASMSGSGSALFAIYRK
jgi:4-diphosphocytidyl-2-C-methyl-D-erythritol kinase